MYVISLHHTMRHERYITLWRPDNRGYCYSKDNAGFYEPIKEGYHNDENNMPISKELANELFEELPYDGVLKMMIPNMKRVWVKLGVKMTKDGLIRCKTT